MYQYTLQKDVYFQTNILGIDYFNRWLRIYPDGEIIIRKGYSWNGCSPKFVLFDIAIGTPEGIIIQPENVPITYFASLLHDCLYQFRKHIGITRKQADNEFLRELQKRKFKLAKLYYFAVRIFGLIFAK